MFLYIPFSHNSTLTAPSRMARLKGNGCLNQKGDPVERERLHKISVAKQRAEIDAYDALEAELVTMNFTVAHIRQAIQAVSSVEPGVVVDWLVANPVAPGVDVSNSTGQAQKAVETEVMSKATSKAKDSLFPPAHPDSVFDDFPDDNQSLEEFVEMGKRRPNAKGTGRFKLTKQRSKVLVLYFGDSNLEYAQTLCSFVEAFLLLDVAFESQMGAVEVENSSFRLDDQVHDIEVSKKKRGKKTSYSIDVFSIFDALVHKVKQRGSPYYSVVGLFDESLTEEGGEILGRACGDRVCCINLPLCNTKQLFFSTTCHEIMHTMGVDHNSDDRCLMNPIAVDEEEWMFLSLLNIQKLRHIHEESNQLGERYRQMLVGVGQGGEKAATVSFNDFVVKYHTGLLAVLDHHVECKKEVGWLRKVIQKFSE